MTVCVLLDLVPPRANHFLPAVSAQFNFPKEEEKVLAFWKEIDAFRTSLKLSEGRPEFSFYDGPPFATGLPHYGHLLAGTIKVSLASISNYPTANPSSLGYRHPACSCERIPCNASFWLGYTRPPGGT
jgi:hypothetical protein